MDDDLLGTIRALRRDLEHMEAALAAQPAVDGLAFLELDTDQRISALSPAAAVRLSVDPDTAVGSPIGALTDLRSHGGALYSLGGVGQGGAGEEKPESPVLRIGTDGGGALLVLGQPGTLPAAEGGQRGRASSKFLHDLANVLGIIRGHSELLAMELDNDSVQRATAEILEAVERAQELLESQRRPDLDAGS